MTGSLCQEITGDRLVRAPVGAGGGVSSSLCPRLVSRVLHKSSSVLLCYVAKDPLTTVTPSSVFVLFRTTCGCSAHSTQAVKEIILLL